MLACKKEGLCKGKQVETHKICRGQPGLKTVHDLKTVRVDDGSPKDAICGLLNYQSQNGETYYYSEVGTGCLWVYLTDCNGNIEAATTHYCTPGHTLTVDGCHAFGCGCD
jgi:hypothetical protein